MTLTNKDVVRHPLVQKIINAYEKADERKQASRERKEEEKRKRAFIRRNTR